MGKVGLIIFLKREIVASKRLQTNKAYKASVAAKKAETALFGDEDDEPENFNQNIRK